MRPFSSHGLAFGPRRRPRLRTALVLTALLLPGLAPRVHGAATPPPGYYLRDFAAVATPTAMAFGPDGWLYCTTVTGRVQAFRDADGNGVADSTALFAQSLVRPLGVAVHGGAVYVSSLGKVVRFQDLNGDHVADLADTLITGLPYGAHQNSGIAFGPDGNLYVTVGTVTSTGIQTHPWSGTILRFTSDGIFDEIFAGGFRNPYDLAFNSQYQLFATDNSPSGDSTWTCYEAPDELNWIQRGANYGFPYCFGSGDCIDFGSACVSPPCGSGDCEWGQGCKSWMTEPIWLLDPHSSSDGLCFGDGFAGFGSTDLFVAQWGQDEPVAGCNFLTGRRVVHITVRQRGQKWIAENEEDFVTGLRSPLAVRVGPDSSLYIADFYDGKIVRLARTGVTGVGDGTGLGGTRARLAFRADPNPARGPVTLHWTALPPEGTVTLEVFDVAGRRVADLGSFHRPDALPDVRWSLRDEAGRRVPAGLYIVRARSGNAAASGKVLVLP